MTSLAARQPVHPAYRIARIGTLWVALFAASIAAPAVAAKVYRCGNTFQDQPCPVIKIAVATPTDRPLAIASDCTTREASGRSDCVPKSATAREVPVDIRR